MRLALIIAAGILLALVVWFVVFPLIANDDDVQGGMGAVLARLEQHGPQVRT